ncbi:hypothetical protein ACFS3C_25725 [Azotobacter vinelandii]
MHDGTLLIFLLADTDSPESERDGTLVRLAGLNSIWNKKIPYNKILEFLFPYLSERSTALSPDKFGLTNN